MWGCTLLLYTTATNMTSLEERLSPMVTSDCCKQCCRCKNDQEQHEWQQYRSCQHHYKAGFTSIPPPHHNHQHREYHQQRTGFSSPQALNCWRYAQTTNYWLSLLRFSTVFQKLEHFQKSLKFRCVFYFSWSWFSFRHIHLILFSSRNTMMVHWILS